MPTKREQEAALRYEARGKALCGIGLTDSPNLGAGLFLAMVVTAEELRAQMVDRAKIQRDIKAFAAEIEEIKNDALLSEVIDGKNAEIRSAQLAKALGETLSYQAAQKAINDYQRQADEANAEVEYLTNKLAAQRAESRRITAVLTALAEG